MPKNRQSASGPPPSAKHDDPSPAWAWAAYQPAKTEDWNLSRAGHLLRRAGFGGTWEELQQVSADGPQRSVDKFLRPEADMERFNRDQDQWAASTEAMDALRAWWLRRMLQTPQPLLEKMTLFWHGYFGISGARMASPSLMSRHVQRLRSHALGKFDALLESLVSDPAVLLGLDAGANRKAAPNEHAARVWLECYTVGPDNCSPQDVHALSRAQTGWFVLRGESRFLERESDDGDKQLFGRRGKFRAQEAVRVLLEHPATARFVVKRLYRWLISETEEPSAALLAPLAEAFAKDYDIAKLVGTILRSNHFFSAGAYRRRIKCPIEFAVGLVRSFEGMVETVRLGQDLAGLGQDLYHPPTVRGWAGAEAWVNPALLLGRQNLAAALLGDSGSYANKLDPSAVAGKRGPGGPPAQARFLVDLLLQGDLPDQVRELLFRDVPSSLPAGGGEAGRWSRQFTQRLTALPEFQLA